MSVENIGGNANSVSMSSQDALLLSLCSTGNPRDVMRLLSLDLPFSPLAEHERTGRNALEIIAAKLITSEGLWFSDVAPRLMELGFSPTRLKPDGLNAKKLSTTTNPPLAKFFGEEKCAVSQETLLEFVRSERADAVDLALSSVPLDAEKMALLLRNVRDMETFGVLSKHSADPFAKGDFGLDFLSFALFSQRKDLREMAKMVIAAAPSGKVADSFVDWCTESQKYLGGSVNRDWRFTKRKLSKFMRISGLSGRSLSSEGVPLVLALARRGAWGRIMDIEEFDGSFVDDVQLRSSLLDLAYEIDGHGLPLSSELDKVELEAFVFSLDARFGVDCSRVVKWARVTPDGKNPSLRLAALTRAANAGLDIKEKVLPELGKALACNVESRMSSDRDSFKWVSDMVGWFVDGKLPDDWVDALLSNLSKRESGAICVAVLASMSKSSRLVPPPEKLANFVERLSVSSLASPEWFDAVEAIFVERSWDSLPPFVFSVKSRMEAAALGMGEASVANVRRKEGSI